MISFPILIKTMLVSGTFEEKDFTNHVERVIDEFYSELRSILGWYKVMLNDILNGETIREDKLNRLATYLRNY